MDDDHFIDLPPEIRELELRAIRTADSDAAFQVARWCAEHGFHPAAISFFKYHFRLGGSYWRTVEYTSTGLASIARQSLNLALRLEYPRVDAPGIKVSPRIFRAEWNAAGYLEDVDTAVQVQSRSPSDAAAALADAAARLREHLPDTAVSGVREDPQGPWLDVGIAFPYNGEQLRAVLDTIIVSLSSAGVHAAYLGRRSDSPAYLYEPIEQWTDEPPADVGSADSSEALTSFESGRWHLAQGRSRHAEPWLRRAVRLGDGPMMWRVVDLYCQTYFESGVLARAWMRLALQLQFPRRDAPMIKVDPQLFAPIMLDGMAGFGMDTSIHIISNDPEKALEALASAVPRLGLVDQDGKQFASDSDLATAGPTESGEERYTPNWVSDVEVNEAGPSIVMDIKDASPPLMAKTMIDVVIDELMAADLWAATIRPKPAD